MGIVLVNNVYILGLGRMEHLEGSLNAIFIVHSKCLCCAESTRLRSFSAIREAFLRLGNQPAGSFTLPSHSHSHSHPHPHSPTLEDNSAKAKSRKIKIPR
jgi:hypothetical protein